MKYIQLASSSDCSVIHGWFLYCLFADKCTACQSHWKSDFGWHRFQKWAYSLALAWGVRGLKILEHLMSFRSSISTGKPEKLSLMCFFFRFPDWAYGLCGLSLYTSNDLTYNSIRFKKPLDIFWPQIQRKGSEDYLVTILAVNGKLRAIFLPRVHLEKAQTPGSRLKT